MALSIISVVCMSGMFLMMLNKAKYARTRRMALIPLICAGMELLFTGVLTPGLFPVLTGVLVLLRAVILACCVGALRQDAAMAKRRARRLKAVRPVVAKEASDSRVCA